jgi:putative ABC transport system permease protein
MKNLWQELRYGVRTLLSRPILSAVVVLTIALGIGANTAIFSVVNRVLLSSLPRTRSNSVAAAGFVNARPGDEGFTLVSPADFLDWDAQSEMTAKPENEIGNEN